MKRLIVNGDPGVRKDGVIRYDGEEMVLYAVNRNGEFHGPERVQLWCVIGTEEEREEYEKRNFVPHFLEVDSIDAEDVDIVKAKGDLAI